MNPYETDRLVSEYLLFHYGRPGDILPWNFGPRDALGFPVRSVSDLLDIPSLPPNPRALDLGCAVGRSAFELARTAVEVTGIDFSHAFVRMAERIRSGESVTFPRLEEAREMSHVTVCRPEAGRPEAIRFEQGDAMALREDLGAFDVVHAANLLCRLPEPRRLLERLPALVRPGGQLLLTTPCTWLEEFTPPANWPPASTRAWLESSLGADFEIELTLDMPFLIREHARKFQWSVALGTRWRRR